MSGGAAHREVSFKEALSLGLKNFAEFQGRSSRGACWWWLLVYAILSTGLSTIDYGALGAGPGRLPVLTSLFGLAALIPNGALGARRLHDIGKSAWWLLFILAPIGGLILLAILFALPGERSENRFGPDVEAGKSADGAKR